MKDSKLDRRLMKDSKLDRRLLLSNKICKMLLLQGLTEQEANASKRQRAAIGISGGPQKVAQVGAKTEAGIEAKTGAEEGREKNDKIGAIKGITLFRDLAALKI